jgi:hypothetical protein
MSPAALLGITKWFRWTVGPDLTGAIGTGDDGAPLKVVSIQRLKELAPRLQQVTEGAGRAGHHELVRFNLLNLDDEPVAVCAIGLPNVSRQMLRCDVVPAVIVDGGAVYPFMLEIRSGLGLELVDIQIEPAFGDREWVFALGLPRP